MRLLLDSHAFLWFLTKSTRLSERADMAISEAQEVWLSHVSIWEITIKRALGRLELEDEPATMAERCGIAAAADRTPAYPAALPTCRACTATRSIASSWPRRRPKV